MLLVYCFFSVIDVIIWEYNFTEWLLDFMMVGLKKQSPFSTAIPLGGVTVWFIVITKVVWSECWILSKSAHFIKSRVNKSKANCSPYVRKHVSYYVLLYYFLTFKDSLDLLCFYPVFKSSGGYSEKMLNENILAWFQAAVQ